MTGNQYIHIELAYTNEKEGVNDFLKLVELEALHIFIWMLHPFPIKNTRMDVCISELRERDPI